MPLLRPTLTNALLTGIWSIICGEKAFADGVTGFNFHAAGGLSTYKSKMLQSNDTGTTIGYGLAVHAGNERGMSMGLEREQSTFPFALNNASLAHADGDKLLDQNATAQEYLDILAPGYGARTGLRVAFSKRGAAFIDVRYATASKVQQAIPEEASTAGISGTSPALGRKVTVGPRMSIDFGASLPITRDLFSFIAGYKYRTYAVSVESEAFAELHTSTYIGMTMDVSL
jgi:hypothetical protein